MEQLSALLEVTQAWTLFHWAAVVFGIGLASIMSRAVWEEIRAAKGIVGKFFIVCMAAGAALVLAALLIEANRVLKVFV